MDSDDEEELGGQYDYLFDEDTESDTQSADEHLRRLTHLLAHTPLPPPTSPLPSPIPGFRLYRAYLPAALLTSYEAWLTAQYFPTTATNQAMHFGALPSDTPLGYLSQLCQRLRSNPQALDQAIINCYRTGEGIGDHVDLRRFADSVCGVSFGAPATMRLAPVVDESQHVYAQERAESERDVYVRIMPGDVYVLEGEARWRWTHGFPRRVRGRVNVKGCRVSVTLRTVVPDE
ncbi:hypothetical protein IW150_002420 [Coemansia sp. RSA 2607]|nr:hypothetical protein IW150_002420 [Coemansia sp. RSA 2607]